MAPSSSFISGDSFDLRTRNVTTLSRPTIDISLSSGQGNEYTRSYSTLDKIEGTATIVSPKYDMRFDNIEIALFGMSTTFVDKLGASPAVNSRSTASHVFLKIKQPITEDSVPQPRIFEAGRKYVFPFTFVVPEQTLPRPCPHGVANEHIHQAHHQLPPSLGDPELAGFTGKLLDDLAPEMAKISYAIKVRMSRMKEVDGKEVMVADQSRKIRIKPAFTEQPPMNISEQDDEFRLRQEKSVKKGMFSGKLGRLVMETVQPRSFHLPTAPADGSIVPVTTMAKVTLRFDPAEETSPPPRLSSLSSRLKVSTFYASTGRSNFPTKKQMIFDANQGMYNISLPLSSRCMASVKWERHQPEKPSSESGLQRRDSGIDMSGTPLPSSAYKDGVFYTATILVPLTLPTNKHIVPTFHSCLISRTYSIAMDLSIHGQGISSPSLTLKVPVQVSDEGNVAAVERRASQQEEEQILTEFAPRSIAPPQDEYLSVGSSMAPPEYEVFASTGRGLGVSVAA